MNLFKCIVCAIFFMFTLLVMMIRFFDITKVFVFELLLMKYKMRFFFCLLQIST